MPRGRYFSSKYVDLKLVDSVPHGTRQYHLNECARHLMRKPIHAMFRFTLTIPALRLTEWIHGFWTKRKERLGS